MDEHMLRAATKARSALAVLAAELGEPSPDMAQALAIIEQMLGDIEAGRHPARIRRGVSGSRPSHEARGNPRTTGA